MTKLSKAQSKRVKALKDIVRQIGGRNVANVAMIAAKTYSSNNTVYAWLSEPPKRIIPQSKLDLLSRST